MRTFRTYMNNKAMNMIKNVIRAEDLDVAITVENNAIGDTMIVAVGDKEDIETLAIVYEMIK